MTPKPDGTPHQRLRKFYLPFIYGIATANFITVIQLVSAPQFDWKLLAAADEIQFWRLIGFVGMVWLCASIPMLISCAFYYEITSGYTGHLPENSQTNKIIPLRLILAFGLLPIPLTLTAFHPAFGISFGAAMLLSIVVGDIALARFWRNDPTSLD